MVSDSGKSGLAVWYLTQEKVLDAYHLVAESSDYNISIRSEYNISECLVRVGKSTTGAFIEVQPELNVGEVIKYIEFVVETDAPDTTRKGKTESLGANAFSMLMETARNCQELPDIEEERNNKIRQRNDIII